MNKKQKKMLVRIVIAAVTLIAAKLAQACTWISAALYLLSYAVIGYDILLKAFKGILNRKLFDENFLMAVATLGAIGLAIYEKSGDYSEAVAVMLFYQIGELFQSYAVGKSRPRPGGLPVKARQSSLRKAAADDRNRSVSARFPLRFF